MKKLTIFIVGSLILLGGCFFGLWLSKPCNRLDLSINYTGCFRQIDVYHLFTLNFSNDLTMFSAESLDRTTVWRTADAQILYQAPFGELALFSPDSAFWLLVVLDNQSLQDRIEIWRTEDWTLVKTLNVGMSKISGVAISPDNRYLAIVSPYNPIQIWRTRDWSLLYTVGEPSASPDVVYSPNGEVLASWSDDKKIELWRTKDGSLLSTLTGHSSAISKVVFAPDSKTLASSSWDSTVRVWRTDGTLLHILEGHSEHVWDVAYTSDGQFLASAGNYGLVQLWDVNKGASICSLRHNWVGEPVYRVAFSPDGKVLATFQKSGPVRLFDAQQLLGTNRE
jgi:WD40 repeat protein